MVSTAQDKILKSGKARYFKVFRNCLLLCLLFTNPVQAETSVQVIALFNGKAMLSIDGKRAKVVKAGDSLHGVRLIESNTK